MARTQRHRCLVPLSRLTSGLLSVSVVLIIKSCNLGDTRAAFLSMWQARAIIGQQQSLGRTRPPVAAAEGSGGSRVSSGAVIWLRAKIHSCHVFKQY